MFGPKHNSPTTCTSKQCLGQRGATQGGGGECFTVLADRMEKRMSRTEVGARRSWFEGPSVDRSASPRKAVDAVALSVSTWAETRRSRVEMLMRMFTVQRRVWTQAPLAGAQRSLARGSPRSVARLTRPRGADRAELVQGRREGHTLGWARPRPGSRRSVFLKTTTV